MRKTKYTFFNKRKAYKHIEDKIQFKNEQQAEKHP